MAHIFKVGDIVYHWRYGRGVVDGIHEELSPYDMEVVFDIDPDGGAVAFTRDGFEHDFGPPSLSFEPYDLVNGGFSQVRPLPDIKKGTPVFVKCGGGDWHVRVFSHFDENRFMHTFHPNSLSGSTMKWYEYSLETPIDYDNE